MMNIIVLGINDDVDLGIKTMLVTLAKEAQTGWAFSRTTTFYVTPAQVQMLGFTIVAFELDIMDADA